MSSDTEFWMTNLADSLKTLPIVQLAIPGSHDSGTYGMTTDSDLSPDADDILKDLEFLGALLKGIMYKWSRTQEATATQQLNSGIRYFDLRIATRENDANYYLVHGLYATEFNSFVKDVNDFLNSHSKEVVILDFNHFYAFESDRHDQLVNLLIATFGGKLLPVSGLSGISLDYMTNKNNYQVIVVYRASASVGGSLLWSSDNFPTPWADTTDVDTLISFLKNGVATRDNSIAFISQCILTPDTSFLVEHLTSNLKDQCLLPLEDAKYEWLNAQKPGSGGVNIVISDFAEYNDGKFPKTVIDLNAKLLRQ